MKSLLPILMFLSTVLHDKWAGIILRLTTLIGTFQTLDAHDVTVPTSAWQSAADMLLTSGTGQKIVASLPAPVAQALQDGGAAAMMRILDGFTEGG